MLPARLLGRAFAIAAIVLAVAVLAVVSLGLGSSGYEVTARFRDAGQLVKGGTVQVAGRTVGTISDIHLGDDGVAEVVLGLDDDLGTLHRGTTAQIRSLGLSGVANRFVALKPGPASGAEIPDGGRLELTETAGIVDLDAVLTSLDPTTRTRLQGLLRSGGVLGEGDTPAAFNRTLRSLNPAVSEGRALARELTRDRAALQALLRAGATAAGTVAAHDSALRRGLDASATTLQAVADERGSLDGLLRRSPAALRRMGTSLDRIGGSFDRARPTLRELTAAAPALAGLARELPPATQTLRPVLADLRGTLPSLNAALTTLPPLRRAALPALTSGASALRRLTPILVGLRPYAPDLVAGVFLGFGGTAGASYDANGHLARIALTSLGAGSPGIGSLTAPDGALGPLAPVTKRTNRCPGGGAQLAPDGSNDAAAGTPNCDPKQARR